MAGIKITNLPIDVTLLGSDYVIVSNDNTTYKTTVSSLLEYYQTPILSLSAGTYSIALSNNNSYIRLASSLYTPKIVISPNSAISWPIGYTVTLKDVVGTGFALSALAGVTLNTVTSAGAAFQGMQLINVGTNIWDVL